MLNIGSGRRLRDVQPKSLADGLPRVEITAARFPRLPRADTVSLKGASLAMNLRVLLCLGMLSAVPLGARNKTDILIMKNGDHLTCEIKSLDSGVLYVSLDYILGTSSLQWSKVARIESKQLFIVKTQDGRVYTSTLNTAETGPERPMQISVQASPERTDTLNRSEVVNIGETSPKVWQRFNGSIDSNIIFSKANSNTQYSLNANAQYVQQRWNAGSTFSSTLSNSSGAMLASRDDLGFTVMHLLRWNNYYYGGLADFLQSSEQGIQLQTSLGGGIGRYLKHTNRASVSLLGGLAWQGTNYDQAKKAGPTQNVVSALVVADLRFFRFNKTTLDVTGTLYPALNDPGRVRFNTNASYYIKLFSNLSWNFSFYGNWDNRAPPGFASSDYGTSSGLTWTFGSR